MCAASRSTCPAWCCRPWARCACPAWQGPLRACVLAPPGRATAPSAAAPAPKPPCHTGPPCAPPPPQTTNLLLQCGEEALRTDAADIRSLAPLKCARCPCCRLRSYGPACMGRHRLACWHACSHSPRAHLAPRTSPTPPPCRAIQDLHRETAQKLRVDHACVEEVEALLKQLEQLLVGISIMQARRRGVVGRDGVGRAVGPAAVGWAGPVGGGVATATLAHHPRPAVGSRVLRRAQSAAPGWPSAPAAACAAAHEPLTSCCPPPPPPPPPDRTPAPRTRWCRLASACPRACLPRSSTPRASRRGSTTRTPSASPPTTILSTQRCGPAAPPEVLAPLGLQGCWGGRKGASVLGRKGEQTPACCSAGDPPQALHRPPPLPASSPPPSTCTGQLPADAAGGEGGPDLQAWPGASPAHCHRLPGPRPADGGHHHAWPRRLRPHLHAAGRKPGPARGAGAPNLGEGVGRGEGRSPAPWACGGLQAQVPASQETAPLLTKACPLIHTTPTAASPPPLPPLPTPNRCGRMWTAC